MGRQLLHPAPRHARPSRVDRCRYSWRFPNQMFELGERIPKLRKRVSDTLAVIDPLQDMMLSPEAVDRCSKRPSECGAIGSGKNQEEVMDSPAGGTRADTKL